LGVLAMILALMFHEIGSRGNAPPNSSADKLGFPIYLVGGLIFIFGFLSGGLQSVPRRMAEHLITFTDKIGTVGAVLVVLAMLYFGIRIILGLLKAPSPAKPPPVGGVHDGITNPVGEPAHPGGG